VIVRIFEWPLVAIASARYSPALHQACKQTPGMRWERAHCSWVGYPDAIDIVLRKLAKKGIHVEGKNVTRKDSCEVNEEVLGGLREYQKEAVRFLVANAAEGALCADQMGLGKTVTAIRAAKALGGPTIIVCPSFVRMVWRSEIRKWRPKARVIELSGVKAASKDFFGEQPEPNDMVVVHYDIVHAWVPALIESYLHKTHLPTTVIFDEIHKLQSEGARRSVACRDLRLATTNAIGLSGTPMTSRPRDLWNPVDTLCPGRFGKPFAFYERHSDLHQETISLKSGPRTVWRTEGASNLKELRRRLKWFMIRRTKTDVALELPPKTRQVIELQVPKTHRHVTLTDSPKRLVNEALAKAADGKLGDVVDIIESHVEQGNKVVVFCHRIAIAEALAASFSADGIDARSITGKVLFKKREQIIGDKPTVLCCTMDSCETGIDLSFANVAVFVELDWVPSKLLQCEARLARYGQSRNVLIQYVIATGTIDEIIQHEVIRKLEHFEQAIGATDDRLRQDFSGEDTSDRARLARLAQKLRAMV
jgi:SWI/SNF-related matrix-associated actin-dependent regulator 1 of chromatin subfamily A